jgi:hypothetical protein
VTERFYRGDASRGTPGVGLGLSLVAAVAKLHGGSLRLSDNNPGLRATLILMSAAMTLRPTAAGASAVTARPWAPAFIQSGRRGKKTAANAAVS